MPKRVVVGVPKEVKYHEGRVGLTANAVFAIVRASGSVLVETGAGKQSGFTDAMYIAAGAAIVPDASWVWKSADIVVKVKEPVREEYQHLLSMRGKTLFTYLHLAGTEIELTRALMRNDVTAIAYETVSTVDADGKSVFPLLVPMSIIAGTQSMRGALARHKQKDMPGLNAVIIGGGNVGEAALRCAIAEKVGFTVVFESWDKRVSELRRKYSGEHVAVFPMSLLNDVLGKNYIKVADVVICGPMLPGGREAPIVLTQSHFRTMKEGCYISDVSIDQGGSTAWTHGHSTKPGETFTRGARKLVFSAVPNIPGSTVPEEATKALTDATLPYVLDMVKHRVAGHDDERSVLRDNVALRLGLQTYHGVLTNEFVATRHGLIGEYRTLGSLF